MTRHSAIALLACGMMMGGVVTGLTGCASSGNKEGPLPVGDRQPVDYQRGLELVQRGERAMAEGEYDAAIDAYVQAIGAAPELAVAYQNLGCVYAQRAGLGDALRASNYFQKAAELAPSDPIPIYSIATLFHNQNRLEDARQYYLEALQRDPNHLASLREAIRIDHELVRGDEETMKRIERALQIDDHPRWIEMYTVEARRIRERGYN